MEFFLLQFGAYLTQLFKFALAPHQQNFFLGPVPLRDIGNGFLSSVLPPDGAVYVNVLILFNFLGGILLIKEKLDLVQKGIAFPWSQSNPCSLSKPWPLGDVSSVSPRGD